jgi:hypothetical protein
MSLQPAIELRARYCEDLRSQLLITARSFERQNEMLPLDLQESLLQWNLRNRRQRGDCLSIASRSKPKRQIGDGHHRTRTADVRLAHDRRQFIQVPRPVVGSELFPDIRAESQELLARVVTALQCLLGQERKLVPPLAQGRKRDLDDSESITELREQQLALD